MWIGVVVGTVVATQKDDRLVGLKLLMVRPLDLTSQGWQEACKVVVDRIGAGVGEKVLVVGGSPARMAVGNREAPVDAAVVGIVDQLDMDASLLDADAETGVDADADS